MSGFAKPPNSITSKTNRLQKNNKAEHGRYFEIRRTARSSLRIAMEMFVDLAVNIGAKPILVTQARLVHSSNTPVQRERIEYHHVSLTHEALVETFDRLDKIVRDVAAEKEVMLIDASAELSGKDWAFSDHVHFDLEGRGSEAISQLIADHLKAVLLLPTGK